MPLKKLTFFGEDKQKPSYRLSLVIVNAMSEGPDQIWQKNYFKWSGQRAHSDNLTLS